MESKELKIQIPVGYEIDKDHSTFECIKFKPIKKDITYEDVCNTLFKNNTGYFIDQYGEINFYNIGTNRFDANNAPNGRQLKKLLALNKLFNIAEYPKETLKTAAEELLVPHTYNQSDDGNDFSISSYEMESPISCIFFMIFLLRCSLSS